MSKSFYYNKTKSNKLHQDRRYEPYKTHDRTLNVSSYSSYDDNELRIKRLEEYYKKLNQETHQTFNTYNNNSFFCNYVTNVTHTTSDTYVPRMYSSVRDGDHLTNILEKDKSNVNATDFSNRHSNYLQSLAKDLISVHSDMNGNPKSTPVERYTFSRQDTYSVLAKLITIKSKDCTAITIVQDKLIVASNNVSSELVENTIMRYNHIL